MSPRLLAPSLALGLAAGLLTASPARAEDHSISPGFLLSLSLGDRTAFGLGFDLRYAMLFGGGSCGGGRRAGVGVFGQAHWLNFSAGRFAAGVHGGSEVLRPLAGVDGEFGWTYRASADPGYPSGHGLQAGVASLIQPDDRSFGPPVFEISLRGAFPLPGEPAGPEIMLGTGLRYPGVFGAAVTCIEGRPLRVEGAQALAPVAATAAEARAMRLDAATRAALARAWIEDARGECASIPAFLALARDLRAVAAPRALVRRALEAARDEARHAALCAARAGDYAGMAITPIAPPPPAPADAGRAAALVRLGLESWHDGCLGEGAAAARARRSLAGGAIPETRAAHARIAADEQRHAELSWDILAYCMAEGGRAAREALAEAILAPEPAPPEAREARGEFEPALWRGHGRLDAAGVESTWAETWAKARRAGEKLLRAA